MKCRFHEDIAHGADYRLKKFITVMCLSSFIHFPFVKFFPCDIIVDVTTKFDTWIAKESQICGWLFLW